MAVAKAMQLIKSGSSKWMHDKIALDLFQWQEKYGAFSIGISQVERTIGYINNQKKHHAKMGFWAQEWKAILKRTVYRLKNDQPSLAGLFSRPSFFPALAALRAGADFHSRLRRWVVDAI